MRVLKEIGQRIMALLMVACVFTGIILMMCECEDAKKQTVVLFVGFGLFLLGIAPGLIIGWRER